MRPKVWRRTSARDGRLAAFVVLTGTLVLGVGAASADPVQDDVITACYKTANGALRVIEPDAGGRCAMSEEQLTWSTGFGLPAPDSVDSAAIQDGVILEGDLAASLLDLLATDTEVSTAVGTLASMLSTSSPESNHVHWTNLGGVPAGFADNQDDDGADELRDELGSVNASDTTADETSDLVSWSKIKQLTTGSGDTLDGVITGRFIKNGTVAASDLAPHAVTSDKLALATSQVEGGEAASLATSFASTNPLTADVTVRAGAHHTVTVTGHAQLACTCQTSGDSATVEWRLYDENNDVPVGQTYRGQLSSTNQYLAVSVSHLDLAAPGTHRYSLQVRSTATGTPAAAVSSAVVSAVDLG